MRNLFKIFGQFLNRKVKEKKIVIEQKKELNEKAKKVSADYAKIKEFPSRYSKKIKNKIELDYRELAEQGHI